MVHLQSCTESGLLLTLLRAGMEIFLPSASGSFAAGLKPCGKPTCKFTFQLVTSVHQCPCGRSMHGFCGRGIGKEGHGQQRERNDTMRGHDKTVFVAHENHSVEHNRVISNHSRTPLSYEDVVQRHHYFRRTAVAQFGRSRGGRRSVQRRNETFNHL